MDYTTNNSIQIDHDGLQSDHLSSSGIVEYQRQELARQSAHIQELERQLSIYREHGTTSPLASPSSTNTLTALRTKIQQQDDEINRFRLERTGLLRRLMYCEQRMQQLSQINEELKSKQMEPISTPGTIKNRNNTNKISQTQPSTSISSNVPTKIHDDRVPIDDDLDTFDFGTDHPGDNDPLLAIGPLPDASNTETEFNTTQTPSTSENTVPVTQTTTAPATPTTQTASSSSSPLVLPLRPRPMNRAATFNSGNTSFMSTGYQNSYRNGPTNNRNPNFLSPRQPPSKTFSTLGNVASNSPISSSPMNARPHGFNRRQLSSTPRGIATPNRMQTQPNHMQAQPNFVQSSPMNHPPMGKTAYDLLTSSQLREMSFSQRPFFKYVREGFVATKINTWGSPKERFIWLDIATPDNPSICWNKFDKNDGWGKNFFNPRRLDLKSITTLSTGRASQKLLRRGKEVKSSKYMSFVQILNDEGSERSLDLELPTAEERDWAHNNFVELFKAFADALGQIRKGQMTSENIISYIETEIDKVKS